VNLRASNGSFKSLETKLALDRQLVLSRGILSQRSKLDPFLAGGANMKRWTFFGYGVGCHLLFLAVYAYMAGFVGDFLVPKTIDSSSGGPLAAAVAIDVLLLGLFAVQHSLMARPGFKRVWTRIVPEPIERSTYVLLSCIVTILLMWQWRGIGTNVWDVQQPLLRATIWGLFAAGWLMVPGVTMLLNHFDLFGTRQVWFYLRGREYESLPFRVPMLYRRVRHPLYIGWAIAFWVTPTMSVGHLLFAGVLTGYMALAAIVEERDLVAFFGRQYEDYRRQVPMFIPSLRSTATMEVQRPTRSPVAHEADPCRV
jgi:methanethiol S-methyltransferase